MYKYFVQSGFTTTFAIITALVWAAGDMTDAASGEPSYQDSVREAAVTSETAVRLVVVPGENTARYLVREQLAGFDFPNDAVGETGDITGTVSFDGEGEIIPEESRIVINITGLTSDSNRRDGYIQRRTLESERYPTVELVPFGTRGLEFPLPASGSATFDVLGHLTVRDVTEITSWRVTTRFNEGSMTGTARTEFTFEEFGMEKPSVASVLSVADAIRLEFDFTFNIEHQLSE